MSHLIMILQNAFDMRCDCCQRWAPSGCSGVYRWDNWSLPHRDQDYGDCWQHVCIHYDKKDVQAWTRRRLQKILMSMEIAIASGLRNLSTLSLTIKNEPSDAAFCYCHECLLEPEYFADIINLLPKTCASIELDTGVFDTGGADMMLRCSINKRHCQ